MNRQGGSEERFPFSSGGGGTEQASPSSEDPTMLGLGGGVGGWVLADHSRMPCQENKGLERPETCQSS